jgi:hypothetical protein
MKDYCLPICLPFGLIAAGIALAYLVHLLAWGVMELAGI